MKPFGHVAVCIALAVAAGCASHPGPLRNPESPRHATLDHINGPGVSTRPDRELPDARWYESRRGEWARQGLPDEDCFAEVDKECDHHPKLD